MSRYFWLLYFNLVVVNLMAQPFFVRKLGGTQGLSNNYVNSITQDKCGYIWVATEEGLNRFDGNSFDYFYSNFGQHKLSGNELNCILDDPKDSIVWIATQRSGLNAFNYANNRMTCYTLPQISSEAVTSIAPSVDSSIWVATYWNGINYFDKKNGCFRQYNSTNVEGISDCHIWAVADIGDGNIYIGYSSKGLGILDTTTKSLSFLQYNPLDNASIPSNDVLCLRPDKNGNIWVGTTNGLAVFNVQSRKFVRIDYIDKIKGHSVFDIHHANDGRIWVALELGGIVIIEMPQKLFSSQSDLLFTEISAGETSNSLSGASVRCIHEDLNGNVWAGIWAGGVNFIAKEPPALGYVDASQGGYNSNLNNRGVLSVAVANQNKIYVGTDGGGVNVFQNGQRIATFDSNNSPKIRNNSIQTIYNDGNNIWIGMFNAGLVCMNVYSGKFLTVIDGSGGEVDVRHIADTNSDTLIVATSSGVYVVNKKLYKVVDIISLPQNLARCALRDKNGYTWVGTFGGGMFLLDSKLNKIKNFDTQNGFPSNTVNHIIQTSDGYIFVATGEGLVKLNSVGVVIDVYNISSGMDNAHIRAIAEDTEKNIWFSTNKGVSVLKKNDGKILNFDTRDNICEGSFTSACTAIDNNLIFFGSINGLSFINYVDALKKTTTPKPWISRVTIAASSSDLFDSTINNPSENLILNYWQNTLTISINTRNYAYISQVENECMLEGYTHNWIAVDNKDGNITFRNLSPGKYILKVRSCLRNQDFQPEEVSLNLTIKPPIWATMWAKMLYVLLVVAVAAILMKGYKRRVKMKSLYDMEKANRIKDNNLNEERLKFYTNITHELRTPLTLIMGPIEDLINSKDISGETASKIKLIHRSTQSLLQKVNTLLDFRKTETQNKRLVVSLGNISEVVAELAKKYSLLVASHGVPITVAIEKTPDILFDGEAVLTILNNLISNSIKYTTNGTITIGVQLIELDGNKMVEIIVADTGRGISSDALPHIFERYYQEHGDHQSSGTGIGLALVKNLADLHHVKIEVESKQGKGTMFRLFFNVNEKYSEAIHVTEPKQNDESALQPKNSNDEQPQRKLVLLVEDNRDILNYLKQELSTLYDVATAENGKIGLEIAFANTPDIIVSDIMMPVMNGTDFCRKLKNDIRTSHIPIVLLTAKDSLDDKEYGYNVGADSYLTKPITPKLLLSRIQNLLISREKLASKFVLPSGTMLKKQDNDLTIKQKHDVYMAQLSKLDKEFIDKVNSIIDDNLGDEKLDTPFIASQTALSVSTLYRKMKALTGLTANDYIRKARMKKAEQLLLEGKYSISEIAYMVGFNSNVHFRQCFKEEFGVLPSEYIKQIKKD